MGSISFIFIFASHLIRGQLLKKRMCSRRSKFFPLTVDSILKGLYCPGWQTGCHKNCLPWKNVDFLWWCNPTHLDKWIHLQKKKPLFFISFYFILNMMDSQTKKLNGKSPRIAIQVGTWCQNDVVSTSMRRNHNVYATSFLHHVSAGLSE